MLKLVPSATRDKYFQPAAPEQQRSRYTPCAGPAHGVCGLPWRPVESLRRQVQWKVADLLAGVEHGPWDIILWRNAAMYLKPRAAEAIWRRLAAVLAPGGLLIAGKAERPPQDAGLTHVARCIYRRSAMSIGAKIGAGFALGLVIIVADRRAAPT